MLSAIHNLEAIWHDAGFVGTRERNRRARFDFKFDRWLRHRSEPDVLDEGEFVSQERALDLEREEFLHAHQSASPKPNAQHVIPDAFDGVDLSLDIVAHAPARQSEQAVLLSKAAARFELAGDKKRARSFRAKANRQAWCGIIGHRKDCSKVSCRDAGGKFFRRHDCRLRYCPRSGPKAFRALYGKHLGRLAAVVEDLLRHREEDCRERVIAQIDITRRNTGNMPSSEQVKKFNESIRKLFRRIERELGISRRDYGAGWMDEFGSGNTNLHAHGVYVGPYLPQKLLSRWWHEITGDSFVISIKPASSFEKALSHALKYPSKFWDAPAERLVELEIAFHKVRRFHALARFYNPPETRSEPGMETDSKDESKRCPFCGSFLKTPCHKRGWSWASDLEREGRLDLDGAKVIAARKKGLTADERVENPEVIYGHELSP